MTKYTKIWVNGTQKVLRQSYSLDRFGERAVKNNLFLNKKGAEKPDSTQNKEMKDRYNRIPHTHLSTIELEESKGPVFEPLKLLAAAAGNLIVLQDT